VYLKVSKGILISQQIERAVLGQERAGVDLERAVLG